jgi:hypothetical protein
MEFETIDGSHKRQINKLQYFNLSINIVLQTNKKYLILAIHKFLFELIVNSTYAITYLSSRCLYR